MIIYNNRIQKKLDIIFIKLTLISIRNELNKYYLTVSLNFLELKITTKTLRNLFYKIGTQLLHSVLLNYVTIYIYGAAKQPP